MFAAMVCPKIPPPYKHSYFVVGGTDYQIYPYVNTPAILRTRTFNAARHI